MKVPTENTLTLNITHEMLTSVEPIFPKVTAISPARRWENVKGYDVKLNSVKVVVFQYKRPYGIRRMRRFFRRPSKWIRFPLNGNQIHTLSILFNINQAYIALPRVLDHPTLYTHSGSLVNRTIFIDVYGLTSNMTTLYIPSARPSGPIQYKIRNGGYGAVNNAFVKNWNQLLSDLEECEVGLPIIKNKRKTKEFIELSEYIEEISKIEIEKIIPESRYFFRTKEMLERKIQLNPELRIDSEKIFENLRYELLREKPKDLSTWGIRRARVNIFGQ